MSKKNDGYPDLHDHLESLKARGLLQVIDRAIDKDSELHPLVRWQFVGGMDESERKAFIFTNIVNAQGRRYDIPVVVGALAANREIYSVGMGCSVEEIQARWDHAINHPIKPVLVSKPECQEVIHEGAELFGEGKGLDMLPIPISTPGFDSAPTLTATNVITKHPETGVQNMGTYRAALKASDRMVVRMATRVGGAGGYLHYQAWKALGHKTMPCAVVLGCPPSVAFMGPQKMPIGVDELEVAGGLAGVAIRIANAHSVPLTVPAESEIVIEGEIDLEFLEPEAPFGESHGHVNLQEFNAYMEVTAITRRKKAILTSIISQVTPSESSLIKRVALEPVFLNHLKRNMGIKGVKRVSMHEPLTNLRKVIAVIVERNTPHTEVWRALYGASALLRSGGKFVIAINDDIDPDNADALLWAMSYRANFALDLQIIHHRDPGHGPRSERNHGEDSAMLIDATLKDDFPPIALPKKEFMENAKKIWEELKLPPLRPEAPWFGYSLGDWSERNALMAERAVKSDYFITGEEIAKQRRKDLPMNTEIKHHIEETFLNALKGNKSKSTAKTLKSSKAKTKK